jgi:hypothetical protein
MDRYCPKAAPAMTAHPDATRSPCRMSSFSAVCELISTQLLHKDIQTTRTLTMGKSLMNGQWQRQPFLRCAILNSF